MCECQHQNVICEKMGSECARLSNHHAAKRRREAGKRVDCRGLGAEVRKYGMLSFNK